MRAGTEHVAGIVALGQACALALRDMRQEWERQQQLQQRLEHGIREQIPEVRIQGAQVPRLPNTTNVAFAGVEGEALMMSLDLQGVALSTGSACSSGSLEPSHVLRAMGVPAAYLHGALRCSLGRGTTLADIEYVLEILPGIVQQARALVSPRLHRSRSGHGREAVQYSDIVQEHFEHPRNIGTIEPADAEALVSNPACGDVMHLYLRIENNRITDAKFKTMGCPAAIAAGSVTTELLIGRDVEAALALSRAEVNTALGGLSPQKVHTSVLAEDAVRAALKKYRQR